MPISFLDLVPKRPTAIVTIDGEAGPAEFEVTGIALSQLAEIGRKFPAFARVIEGGATLLSATDAMPAIIAAGLGHYGESRYEEHAAQLPPDVVLTVSTEIIRLTFPRPTNAAEAELAEGGGVNGMLPAPTLPAGLNS
jgi:hypothetical protein